MADDLETVDLLSTDKVRVGLGKALNVEVPAKGATGNVWSVQESSDFRVLSHIKKPSQMSFGGGGTEVFTLQTMHEGLTEITFQLGAPWRSEPAEVHHLSIDVLPKTEVAG